MSTVPVNFRMDEETKLDLESLCTEFGMSVTTFFSMAAKAMIRQRRLPFDVSVASDPFWSISNQEHLCKSIENAESGKLTAHDVFEDFE